MHVFSRAGQVIEIDIPHTRSRDMGRNARIYRRHDSSSQRVPATFGDCALFINMYTVHNLTCKLYLEGKADEQAKGESRDRDGGGQGVGLGIAFALAEEGATIVITGRHEDKLHAAAEQIRAKGAADVLTIVGDTRKRESAQSTVRAAIEKFGRIDVLVNNAQSTSPGALFENIDDATIAMTLESGFLGTLYLMQASFPHLKERGGSIINLGSREGNLRRRRHVGVCRNEGGHSWTLAQRGARMGQVQHPRERDLSCRAESCRKTYVASHPEEAKMYLSQTALGRFGDTHRDIGPIAVFLASSDAGYLTGQTLNADGGQMML